LVAVHSEDFVATAALTVLALASQDFSLAAAVCTVLVSVHSEDLVATAACTVFALASQDFSAVTAAALVAVFSPSHALAVFVLPLRATPAAAITASDTPPAIIFRKCFIVFSWFCCS
jgi:hypothetical protein